MLVPCHILLVLLLVGNSYSHYALVTKGDDKQDHIKIVKKNFRIVDAQSTGWIDEELITCIDIYQGKIYKTTPTLLTAELTDGSMPNIVMKNDRTDIKIYRNQNKGLVNVKVTMECPIIYYKDDDHEPRWKRDAPVIDLKPIPFEE